MTLAERISALTLNAPSVLHVASTEPEISCVVQRADGKVVRVELAALLTGLCHDIADIAREARAEK